MRTFYILLAILIFVNPLSAQYFINENAPINDILIPYHKNHFKLKGPVKVYKTEKSTFYFNDAGYLTKEDRKARITDAVIEEYIYDNNNDLIQIISATYDESIVYNIVLDSKKRVIKKAFGDYIITFEYNSIGNILKHDKSYEVTEYSYDEFERLILKLTGGSFEKFTYVLEDGYLKISQETKDENGQTIDFVKYYKNGINYGMTKDLTYEFDEYGNILNKIDPFWGEKDFQIFEYYQK